MLWGVGLVVALLASSLWRLTPIAIDAIQSPLATWQLVLLVVWVLVMAYSEGYRGFHLRFSPRVVARAYHLGKTQQPLHVVLALPYSLSLFHTTKRQRIVSTVFLSALVVLILAVRQLPPPWRGIVDAGVVVGLGLGTLSIGYYLLGALRGWVPEEAALPLETDSKSADDSAVAETPAADSI